MKPSHKSDATSNPEGKPYGSHDVAHVPPPDPANFWPFTEGQTRTIGHEPLTTFQVTAIHDTWIEGVQVTGEQRILGELHLDQPVNILRDRVTRRPLVTLCLRRIADGKAYLQVSAEGSIPRGTRQ